MWTLTHSIDGTKHVQVIPATAVPMLRPVVERGRQFRAALTELMALNAQLVALWRQQRPRRRAYGR